MGYLLPILLTKLGSNGIEVIYYVLLCVRHCTSQFTFMISFILPNNPVRYVLYYPILQVRKIRIRKNK